MLTRSITGKAGVGKWGKTAEFRAVVPALDCGSGPGRHGVGVDDSRLKSIGAQLGDIEEFAGDFNVRLIEPLIGDIHSTIRIDVVAQFAPRILIVVA